MRPSAPPSRAYFRSLPGSVWALGLVSLLMDASSELIHSVLPLYLTTTLGVGVASVGLLEGMAEATASFVKVFSGTLSDRLGKRKPLILLGYGLAALTKPVFPLAGSVGPIFAARFADRVGKGIRGAPRDALLADVTPPDLRGAAYGLRQALDSVGAFLGPLAASLLLLFFAGQLRGVLWAAVVPAFCAVALIVFGVREPDHTGQAGARPPLAWSDALKMPRRFWWVLGFGAVFSLARFSEAFLLLRGADAGLGVAWIPAVLIEMNLVYALVSYPAGAAADRMSRRALLLAGLACLIAADLVLASDARPWAVFAGAGLWGLQLGLTQGLLSKLVADETPAGLRGTGFGLFYLATGVAALLSSALAGILWAAHGPRVTFWTGAAFAALAAMGLLLPRKKPAAAR